MLTVVCFLWYDPKGKWNDFLVYNAEHVNLLHRTVSGFLSQHEFCCVTDCPKGIDQDIRIVALDRTTFVPHTRFAKLMLFRPDIAEVLGERILYLDLDATILQPLDPLVDRSEDLVLWRNPAYGTSPKRARYNTSMILLKAGSRTEFRDRFTPQGALSTIKNSGWGGTDQAWVSCLASKNEAHWEAQRDGVYGCGSMGDTIPENARIIFYPGRRWKQPWMKRANRELQYA